MKAGSYIVDSVEEGLVKLLFQEDETIEEVVKEEAFSHPIQQGLIVRITPVEGGFASEPLERETEERRARARQLMEKLKNKK